MKLMFYRQMLLAVLLAVILPRYATAQGVQIGNRLIPRSSLEYFGDIGKRAHTNFQIVLSSPQGSVGRDGGLGPSGGLTPAQLRQAYSLPSTGGSQIIAIVDAFDYPNALADFNTFAQQFGLPQETSTNVTASTNKVFQVVYGSGAKPATDSTGGWELEEALDIEWSHAMAPGAKVILVEAASTSFTDLAAAITVAASYVDGNGQSTKEVSNSWGGSEFNGETSLDYAFAGTSATYFASAGDSGAPAQYPSVSPYVISAGGTTVNTNGSGLFASETGWSSGGGGPSAYEAIPGFQSRVSSIVGGSRGTPDISFEADPNTGVSVYDSYAYEGKVYGWLRIGGTSVSSPSLAGIANLAATSQGYFPPGSQALLYTIYTNLGSADFRDITSGNNGYAAAVGWDYVTGVGSCIGLTGLQPVLPVVSSLSPGSAVAGGSGFTLTVNGTGFVSGSIVAWNGVNLTTTFVSSTRLTAAVPGSDIASVGSISVTVANPGGIVSSGITFTVVASPVVTSISPNSALAGGLGFTLTLNGSGFTAGSTVDWNGSGLATTYVSASRLTATVPAGDIASAGSATVTVDNVGSVISNSETFTVVASPVITSIGPNSAIAGGSGFTLSVNGSGFTAGSTVDWNGSSLTTTYVSPGQLTASVPSGDIVSAGTATVTVVNVGSVISNSETFTIVAPPVIASISPATVAAGGTGFTLTVNGSGYVAGSVVRWNGTGLTTSYVSSSQLNATVPGSYIASAGAAAIGIMNPGTVVSNSVTLTISTPPVISALSPGSALAGGPAFTLTVTGSGFVSGSQVRWNGSSLSTTYVSATQLTASVASTQISSPGSVPVSVLNSGGLGSNSVTFTVVALPIITAISPGSAAVGSPAFNLTVTGSGFVSGSLVRWNGSNLTTTFVSSTQLTATVPASAVQTAGSNTVTVYNTGNGGVLSNAQIFLVGSANLQATVTGLSRTSGNIQVQLTFTNFGTANAVNTQITGAVLSTSSTTTPIPVVLGSINGGGGTASCTLMFPNVGAPGTTNVKLKIAGTFSGGTFLITTYVTLP